MFHKASWVFALPVLFFIDISHYATNLYNAYILFSVYNTLTSNQFWLLLILVSLHLKFQHKLFITTLKFKGTNLMLTSVSGIFSHIKSLTYSKYLFLYVKIFHCWQNSSSRWQDVLDMSYIMLFLRKMTIYYILYMLHICIYCIYTQYTYI